MGKVGSVMKKFQEEIESAKRMKVLSMEVKVNVIKDIENGKKKCDMFHDSGLFTSTVQTM